jgi:arsenite methyltransferase
MRQTENRTGPADRTHEDFINSGGLRQAKLELKMDEKQIKTAVREHYAQIATGRQTSCCEPQSSSQSLIGYEQIGFSLPEGANLGLGCGLPTVNAAIQPGDVVLDLGSGAGVDVFLAAQAAGETGWVIGVDMTPEMIARARQNAAQGGYTNVEFRQGEIEHLPVQDDSVDVILSNCVINLSPDKRQVFAEMYRVLKPGGRFSIADVVTTGNVPAALRADLEAWSCCIGGAMDLTEYLSWLREVGFVGVQVKDAQGTESENEGVYSIQNVTVEGWKQKP